MRIVRQTIAIWVLLIAVGMLSLWAAPVPKDKVDDQAGRFEFIAFDDFEGRFRLNWKPVRPDKEHISFTKLKGCFTITTQRGTIHAQEKEDAFSEGTQAKNIYLIDNLLANDVDWMLTTAIFDFKPETIYQQAGLILYNDDDNYLKFDYEYNSNTKTGNLVGLKEIAAKSEILAFGYQPDEDLKKVWLRIIKRKDRFELLSSTDGIKYISHHETTFALGIGMPKMVGLIAKNGGNKEASEIDAHFDFFEMRSPIPAKVAAKKDFIQNPAEVTPIKAEEKK